MGFFNSISFRLPLAVIGGLIYGLLAYPIVLFFNPFPGFALTIAFIVFLLYLGSRLLLLLSGVNTLYYFVGEKDSPQAFDTHLPFHRTAQWVGKFYHYHDIFLITLLTAVSLIFLISLVLDFTGSRLWGSTALDLWEFLGGGAA